MKQITNEQLSLVAGGECLVDYRVAHGITDPRVFTPAVMVPVDCVTGEILPIKTYTYEEICNQFAS